MAHKISVTDDGNFAVVHSKTGEEKGRHKTRARAQAQLVELEQETPEEEINDADVDTDQSNLDLSYAKSIGFRLGEQLLAIKSIGSDKIAGYMALWGSSSMTDVENEYFTKSTDFWDNTLGKNPRPLTWDHAQDGDFKADPVIGQIEDFGDDDIGRWFNAKLVRSHKYRKAIDALIERGKLGASSDSAPQYVERIQTGKSTWLKRWPMFAVALTDTPAEPRMIGSVDYFKSCGITLPDNSIKQNWEWNIARKNRLSLLKY